MSQVDIEAAKGFPGVVGRARSGEEFAGPAAVRKPSREELSPRQPGSPTS